MKSNKIALIIALIAGLTLLSYAAEATKTESQPAPTIESLTAKVEDLTKQVAALTATNKQLQAALNRAVEQRNAAQDAELNRVAAQAVSAP